MNRTQKIIRTKKHDDENWTKIDACGTEIIWRRVM